MKLIEKLKNVFFEEVPEDEDEEELPQTFAKKIEVPKKPVEKEEVEELRREDRVILQDDEEEEKEKTEELQEVEEEPEKEESTFPMMFDDDDFLEDKKENDEEENAYVAPHAYHREEREEKELYQGKKELSYIESVRKPSYSYTKSYYEEKETKGFRPSPIISPVYGVLDKNYRKEEVVTKKETKISASKTNFDLDSVRNKAFGNDDEEISDKKTREAKAEAKENKKIYDVNNNKPQVNRVTLADADEYYNDLGLAYNVDYSDASRNNNNSTRTSKYNIKNNKKEKEKDVDDNLFDLIDSMYSKED